MVADLSFRFLEQAANHVAPLLLGCFLERKLGNKILRGKVVEVEAYNYTDAASHSYKGQTPRTKVMFGPAGRLYVYFTYGMHYCCNIVVGKNGQGEAVLIRAIEPLEGQDEMRQKRGSKHDIELTNGPAKLCQALSIDKSLNGHDLHLNPLKLIPQPPLPIVKIIQTTRIGISQAKDTPWRFYIRDNNYISKH